MKKVSITRILSILSVVSLALLTLFFFGSLVSADNEKEEGFILSGEVILNKSKAYKDLYVYIKEVKGDFTPDKEPLIFDQQKMQFVPRVLVVTKGATVKFVNSDKVAHNVFSPEGDYNLGTWNPGAHKKHVFDKEGIFTQLCLVHPEMEGFIVVLQNPYFAKVKDDHSFELPHIPAGVYKLKLWSPKLSKKGLKKTYKLKLEADKKVTLDLTK